LKILIISPGYLPVPAINGGAVESLIDTIVNENEKQQKITITVIGINSKNDNNDLILNSTIYKYINNKSLLFKIKKVIYALINKIPNIYIGNAYIREVIKKLKKENIKYDKIIIENNPLYGLVLKKYINYPMILHLHNDYLNKSSKKNLKVYKCYERILTVSDYIGKRVAEINLKNNNKIYTLYNGIDISKFKQELSEKEKNKIRNKYKIHKNDFIFMYVGRINKQKGVKELIIAFNELNKKYANTKLLIIGSSDFKNSKKSKYINEIQKLTTKNTIFSGYIDNNDIWRFYKTCDTQIVPSIFKESLGDVVIEGLASSLPLIVNNVGGIPEIVVDNSALICNEKDLIPSLIKNMEKIYLDDNDIRESLTKNGIKRAAVFSKEQFYKNYINLIKKR
jgi:spore coat protein SA